MESDQGKIFVGGISWETTDEQLKEYFKAYGDVVEALIMKDRTTGRGRGFGFVVFADPDVSDRVVMDKHTINGKVVEAKKAVPRDEQQSIPKGSGIAASPASHSTRTKKIFVGGLAPNVSEDDFRQYFEQFGNITDVVVMYDHATQRPRGFGFITFDTEEAVDNVLHKTFHELKEKTVEVKRAVPKELSAASARSPTASVGGGYAGPRSSPYGAGYGQTYPSSIGAYAYPNPAAAAAAAARGGYPSYASYGGYGYGAYAGYAGGAAAYGASPGTGYGAATGYGSAGSPAGAGGYVPGSRNGWAAAAPAYGSTSPGYGGNGANYNTGTTPGWASPGPGGQGSTGSPSYGGYAYGGEGGGYGSYGGGGGSVGRSSGYSSGGYGYGGYGDGYGYPDATWRAGSADSYGGGGPNVGGGGVNGGGVGYGGGGGGGGGSVAGGGGGVEEHGPDGGSYGAYGRQSQRGI